MTIRTITLSLVFLLSLLSAGSVGAGDLVQRVFTDRDGLSNSSIWDISFDDQGFVWLATEQGLFRVSNNKVRRIDKIGLESRLSDESIATVINLGQNLLLVSTYQDLYLYDIADNEFTHFGSETLFPDYASGGVFDYVATDEGLMLLTSTGDILRYAAAGQRLQPLVRLPEHEGIPWYNLERLDDGRLLVSTQVQLELRDADGSYSSSLPWKEEQGLIKDIFKDSQGRIWLTSSEGMFRIDVEANSVIRQPDLPFYMTKISEDFKGNLWIASRSGLLKWHPDTGQLKLYKQQLKQQANMEYIYDIEVDKSGLIWVGGAGDGLALVADSPDFLLDVFSAAEPYSLSNEMIWGVYAEGDQVWIGSDPGLMKINRKTKQVKSVLPKGLELNDSIYKLDVLDDSSLLLSTTNGLFVADKTSLAVRPFADWTGGKESLVHKVVFNTYKDWQTPGRIWFATSAGLFYWQPGLKDPVFVPLQRTYSSQIKPELRTLFRASDGKLWLTGDKLFGYLEDEVFVSRSSLFVQGDKRPAVSHIDEVSPGVFWLGTSQAGLFEYRQDTGKLRSLTYEWRVDCPAVSFLQRTVEYDFVGCFNTLIRRHRDSGELKVIGPDDGLISNEFNEGSVYYQQGLGLFLGTPDGLMLLDIDRISNRIADEHVLLESIAVYYNDRTQVVLLPETFREVNPDASLVSFQLTSLDYLNDRPLQLQYRLRREGELQQPNYLYLQGQSQINVTGLEAGAYILEVLGKQNGVWASTPYAFTFRVQQHWWRSSLFTWVLAFSGLLVVSLIIWIRQQQVNRFKKVNLALQESEDRLRQSLKGSDSDLWEWHQESQKFYLDNKSGVLGIEETQVVRGMDEIPIHEDDIDRVIQQWNEMLSGESDRFEAEYRFLRNSGDWSWLSVKGRPVKYSKGIVEKVAGIYSDITAQRKLEDEINLLARAFENTSEGVLILNAEECVQVSNHAAQQIIGMTSAQLMGRSFGELLHEGPKNTTIDQLLGGESSWTGERELHREKGKACPVWLNVSEMRGTKRVTHYVVVFSDITERKRTEADLRRLANYDVLTGLPNRSLFYTRLLQYIQQAERSGEKLALLFLDLDRFKHVNDSYGHSMGDALLVEASNRLQTCISSEHMLCRFGGDEFVILVRNADNQDELNHLAEQILAQIVAPFKLYSREFYISTSIGISVWPDDANQPEELIKNADLAMYHAKEEGRGNFQYYSSERNAEALYHLRLEADLRKALERKEFELHYQPQIDILHGNSLIGMEALLRWNHPKDGYVRPDIFIKVAESCGLIVEIDRWVLRQACIHGADWSRRYSQAFTLSVNISAVHFRQPDFIQGVKQILEETGIPARALGLEITEGVLMKELHVAQSHLKQLQELGIEVSIDDFGTGYSSLAYLRHFEVNTLKIDRSFLIDIATNSADQAIVSSIIELAKNLKLSVVAEGVETQEQLEQIFSRGCHVVQGYYFAKPMAHSQLQSYLDSQGWSMSARGSS